MPSAKRHNPGVRSTAPGSYGSRTARLPRGKAGGSHGGNPRGDKVAKGTPVNAIKRHIALGQSESRRIAGKRGRSE